MWIFQKIHKDDLENRADQLCGAVACSMMWFFRHRRADRVLHLCVLFIKKYYDRIGRDYQALLRSVSRMADGDLDTEITEDLGIYEPMKVELSRGARRILRRRWMRK